MTICYVDIETEALNKIEGNCTIRTIHSIAIASEDANPLVFTSRPTHYSDGSLLDAITIMNNHDIMITHNGIKFDKPVIEQVLNVKLIAKQLDTLILSKLVYTKDALLVIDRSLGWDVSEDSSIRKLQGSFGLEAFGLRLGNEKIDFHDWSELSEEMCIYNKQDVEVTRELYKLLLTRPNYPEQHIIDIEMETVTIIQQQIQYGFYFDKQKAEALRDSLMYEQLTIKRNLLSKYKPMYLPKIVPFPHTQVPAKARKVRTWVYNPYFGNKPKDNAWWYWKGATSLRNKLLESQEEESSI